MAEGLLEGVEEGVGDFIDNCIEYICSVYGALPLGPVHAPGCSLWQNHSGVPHPVCQIAQKKAV